MLYGHGDGSPYKGAEMTVIVFLCLIFPQSRRDADGVVVGQNGDETFVESLVVERLPGQVYSVWVGQEFIEDCDDAGITVGLPRILRR